MAFRINDVKGNAIPLDVLNGEVAEFWNKELDISKGTRPFPHVNGEFGQYFEGDIWAEVFLKASNVWTCSEWHDLRIGIGMLILNRKLEDDVYDIIFKCMKPYTDLTVYFNNKGYTFEYVDENLETD